MQYRYTLEMKYLPDLGERDKTVTVILKNPSAADEKKSDATIRRVETYVHTNIPDAARLNILNIFAYRATYAEDVNTKIKQNDLLAAIGRENDSHIQSLCEDSDYIICAWGSHSKISKKLYDQRLTQVKELITPFESKLYEVKGVAKHYPQHGLYWSYEYPMITYTIHN